MSRSIWKPIYRTVNFDRYRATETGTAIASRSIKLTSDLLGQSLFVHTGRRFVNFNVEPEHLNHAAGEFVPTHVKPKVIRKKSVKKKW